MKQKVKVVQYLMATLASYFFVRKQYHGKQLRTRGFTTIIHIHYRMIMTFQKCFYYFSNCKHLK